MGITCLLPHHRVTGVGTPDAPFLEPGAHRRALSRALGLSRLSLPGTGCARASRGLRRHPSLQFPLFLQGLVCSLKSESAHLAGLAPRTPRCRRPLFPGQSLPRRSGGGPSRACCGAFISVGHGCDGESSPCGWERCRRRRLSSCAAGLLPVQRRRHPSEAGLLWLPARPKPRGTEVGA